MGERLVTIPVFPRQLTSATLSGILLFGLPCPSARGELELVSDDPIEYDHQAQELRARGNAQIRYQGTLLTANEILYNQQERRARAAGNLIITNPSMRVVGEEAGYDTRTRTASGQNLRFGQPPLNAQAAHISASPALVEMEDATVFLGEPRPGAVNIRARRVEYVPDETLRAEGVTLRVGRVPFFYLPAFTRRLDGLGTAITAEAGYTGNLGAYSWFATRTPIFTGFTAGPELGLYGRRGILIGPGLSYERTDADHWYYGGLTSGYIRDLGDTGLDRLGRPIDPDRFFGEWRHKQHFQNNIEITAQADIWSDSEVTRDFRPRLFSENQFSDSFVEAVYLGEGYLLSAFTRVDPNDFQVVPERLPEVRFDLLPRRAGTQFYHQFQASAAVLREDAPVTEDIRSDRLDAYWGLHWPVAATEWLTITPKAGARVTHYQRALEERNDYTRGLGEIGADVEANAFALYDYQNDLWRIDGIRHVVKPKIHYRYIPEADRGARFIPRIDRRPFTTQLEPIDLGQIRHIDEMSEIHTLRYGLDNIFQTRHPSYGSIDLLSLFVANDLRFSREPGQEFVSDIHSQLRFTPVYWLQFDALNRLSPHEPEVREMNAGLTLTDARFWSLRLGMEYHQDVVEQYSLLYSLRLNENYMLGTELVYDAALHRFSRQSYSIHQTLYNTWQVQYQVYFRSGADREADSGVALSLTYLSF
jgi:LPS-assembly protein